MPACLIHYQKNSVIRNCFTKEFQIAVHHIGVHFREKKGYIRTVFRIYCGINIEVAITWFYFAYWFHAPAAQDSADTWLQTKTRFVEEENSDLFTGVSYFGHLFGEFF